MKLEERGIKSSKAQFDARYEKQLRMLQAELIKLQTWIAKEGKRCNDYF